MGSKRSNIRSFRYSDEVAEVLEQQEGTSLNDKFEKLVLYCHEVIPEKKKQVKSLDRDIEKRRKEYAKQCERLRELESLISTLERLQNYGAMVARQGASVLKHSETD